MPYIPRIRLCPEAEAGRPLPLLLMRPPRQRRTRRARVGNAQRRQHRVFAADPVRRLPEELVRLWVRTEDVAPLQPSRHHGSVCALDDAVGRRLGRFRVRLQHLLEAVDGTILARALRRVSDHTAVSNDEVGPDDHAHVLELEPLARVDASDLVDRIRLDEPQRPIVAEIPAHGEAVPRNDDIQNARLLLAPPRPTVPGDEPRLVRPNVLLPDKLIELVRAITNAEIVVNPVERLVGRARDPQ